MLHLDKYRYVVNCAKQLFDPFHWKGGAVAWWLTPRTPDPEVGGSSPTRVAVLCP